MFLLNCRPSELCENPEMIYAISSFSIKQVTELNSFWINQLLSKAS